MTEESNLDEETRLFLLEAYENLDSVESHLVDLENDPSNAEILNDVFRSVHTIKGNAGFLAFQKLEQLCHRSETLLDKLRSGQLSLTPERTSYLLEAVDLTRTILNSIEATGSEGDADIEAVIEKIE